ncbi:MAG: polysaccharide pyruvyl transferase family protein [Methylibium sp.]|uniref:polysaccharide pyruvyl transferase family protein n=1 Tax=Methylibium sp. TaxID=2067992 RepID=UPI001816CAAB|nr:polysaccharide pyruvyl transferase family protein [Methylibium sp.]MBA3597198.1 polysaccharide pyruvyl transferase family protein [Methylibium sp.]
MTSNFLKSLRNRLSIARLRGWAAWWAIAKPEPVATDSALRLLILPSDPWTLIGAKGDEAMMMAVTSQLRVKHPHLTVGVVTATQQARKAAEGLGMIAVPAWSSHFARDYANMRRFHPNRVAIVGADVMDGYYSPVLTAKLLVLADAMARRGVRAVILGFSFNAKPSSLLKAVFNRLSPEVAVNVRDKVSLERLRSFCRTPATLVADAAFMLEPAELTADISAMHVWASSRRAAGDRVLGFNIHPMLVRSSNAEDIAALVRAAVDALRTVMALRAVSVLLISHDYRGAQSDDACLEPLHRALADELGARLMYCTRKFSAAELKAIAGEMDAVVTGRMHLAIATLGMGKPVAALTYQDKFHGLFEHFDYPEKYLLAPAALADGESLVRMMCELIDELPALTAKVAERLPAVIEASRRNVDALLREAR